MESEGGRHMPGILRYAIYTPGDFSYPHLLLHISVNCRQRWRSREAVSLLLPSSMPAGV